MTEKMLLDYQRFWQEILIIREQRSKRMHDILRKLLASALLLTLAGSTLAAPPDSVKPAAKPLLMTHYMPWFSAPPTSPQWGWHWTMNRYRPDTLVNDQPEIASHYTPLIGPYDSGDLDALRCHVLLMKLAGIDGVIVDWYGNDNFLDYGVNNTNTERLLTVIEAAKMHFAVCYEDQTVPKEIAGGVFPETDAVLHGQRLMTWMQTHFFSSPAYLRIQGRPVLLTFGNPYYNSSQWTQVFSVLPQKPFYFPESNRHGIEASVGSFDWPMPSGGTGGAFQAQDKFYADAGTGPQFIAAAFPRFHDIYAQAGIGNSYGNIGDQDGKTYTDTLTRALQSHAPVVQLVTWNDWGEGTQIEPSVQHGYRDLAATQRLRRQYIESGFAPTPADLSLPVEWYKLTKKYQSSLAVHANLAAFFPLVVSGQLTKARALLAKYQ